MKTARVYLESKSYWWYCTKCGHPNYFSIQPSGIYNLKGEILAKKSQIKKGYFVGSCDHTHMGIHTCRKKIDFNKALFKGMVDKFCEKMKDRLSATLKKEDKERYDKLETVIRARVKEEIKAERKKLKQAKLFEKGKKKRKKK